MTRTPLLAALATAALASLAPERSAALHAATDGQKPTNDVALAKTIDLDLGLTTLGEALFVAVQSDRPEGRAGGISARTAANCRNDGNPRP